MRLILRRGAVIDRPRQVTLSAAMGEAVKAVLAYLRLQPNVLPKRRSRKPTAS